MNSWGCKDSYLEKYIPVSEDNADDGGNNEKYVELNSAAVLARNKARFLIEQDYVLSIYLSKHNILSTYDGDYICWHVMFGHRIESLW